MKSSRMNKPKLMDYQRQRVYDWEDQFINADKSLVLPEQAQSLVDYIWKEEGLSHPPRVQLLTKAATRKEASANRMGLWMHERGTKTTVLLHELAHSMTSTFDGGSCQHRPRFVGVYMQLLNKYARIDLPLLMFTAKQAGVEFNFNGKVV